jgi:hypothetical protein
MDAARDVSVATMTLARNASDEVMLHESLERLSRHGLRVAVADGGSPMTFVARLRRLPGVEIRVAAQAGLIGQVKTALSMARA